jgi:hypothetical protein
MTGNKNEKTLSQEKFKFRVMLYLYCRHTGDVIITMPIKKPKINKGYQGEGQEIKTSHLCANHSFLNVGKWHLIKVVGRRCGA